MNGFTIAPLSPKWTQWNWILREDAEYSQLDGKTLCTLTIALYWKEDVHVEYRWEISSLRYHPCTLRFLTSYEGPCVVGSFAGAADSERVPELYKGRLRWVGHSSESVKVEACLTARHTGRAETKVGFSDPEVPCGRAFAQRIKGTPGITGW